MKISKHYNDHRLFWLRSFGRICWFLLCISYNLMGIQNMSHSMPQWFILLLERATLIHTYSLKWDLDMIRDGKNRLHHQKYSEIIGKRCPTWMTLRCGNQSDFEISWVSHDLEVSHCSSVPSDFEISPCLLIGWTSTVPAAAAVHSRQVELHKIT